MKANRLVVLIAAALTVTLSVSAGATPNSDPVEVASEANEASDQATAGPGQASPGTESGQQLPPLPSLGVDDNAEEVPEPSVEDMQGTTAEGAEAIGSQGAVENGSLAAVVPTDTLKVGESLRPGESLTSINGLFRLVVQDDGNVGIYGPNGVTWASMTPGRDARVAVQSDGNAGFLSEGRALLTNTGGTGDGNRLVIQDDGILALRSVGGVLLWSAHGLGTGNSRDALAAGNSIYPGQSLVSRNGNHRLVVQDDGNVGVYGPAGVTWASMSPGAAARVTVQSDGNVGFFSSSRIVETRTGGTGSGHQLVMQDDGNLVLSSVGLVPVWSSKFGSTGSTRESVGTVTPLSAGQALVSNDGQYKLVVQGDGNVGIYGPNGVTWASMTAGANGRLVVQGDGNVGAYSSNRVWASGTGGTGNGHRLTIQDDGNLVLNSAGGVSIWSLRWGRTGNTVDSLAVGNSLYPGHSLISRNGNYRTLVQRDGNVGVYGPGGRVLWASDTPGGNARVTVQGDGNVGFFSSSRILATDTGGTGYGHRLQMQDDGNLALWASSGLPMWSTMGGRYAYANRPLFAYGTLRPTQSAWSRISGFSIANRSAFTAGFSLYYSANRSFPWAVTGGNGVHGDLVFLRSDSYYTAIATMDAYERYDPTLPAANQAYVREVRRTTTGIETWMYVTSARQAAYVRGSLPLLGSGDWLRR